ncbi:MAG: TonB-dependent receptor [Acidobacteriota bacterium]|nr:TonB-dependent receptor [Acidobacteriota bacterium]
MRKAIIYAAGAVLGFALLGPVATLRAQSTFGTLLGTVKDASGAVVPGATVVIRNNDEGTSRTVTTDSRGNYELVDAKPDHYTISVSKPGFKTSQVADLALTSRQTLRADVTLPLGQVTQSVTVQGTALGVISTDTSTVSSSFGHLQITDLPTNYRASANGNSPYYLLTVLPGVQSDRGGNLSIQGALQSQSAFTVDGISTTNVTGNYPLRDAFPSAEAISEMRVQGVGASAEYGDPADVTTISKSGTNALHGSLFEYHQNAALDAIPFGAKGKPKKIANDFGGSLGGPVVIPHLYDGRNKSFFYADFEGFRTPRTGVVQNTVPTQAMRSGDLSNFCTAGFAAGICKDPTEQINNINGQPYLNNQIPTTAISSISQKFLSLYPLPNNGSTYTDGNYRINLPANLSSNTFDVRGDQYFGTKLSVFGRYTYKNINSLSPQKLLIPSSTNFNHVRMLVASATYSLTPTILDEFRFGFTNEPNGTTNPFNGKAFTTPLGLDGISNLWFNGVPEIDFSGATSNLDVDRLNGVGQSRTIEFLDNLTWIKGRHTFKFGADTLSIRAVTTLGFFGADNYGTFSFTGLFTNNDFSDFLLGLPEESDLDNVTADNDGRSRHWALYGLDSFRVNNRLTLDYGVRWEYHPGYTDAHGNIGNFNNHVPLSGQAIYPNGFAANLAPPFLQTYDSCPVQGVPLTANDPLTLNGAPCTPTITASQAGYPQGLRWTSKRFLPRFGFAYMPFHSDKTVVRGSIGSYEAATLGNVFYSLTGTLQAYTRTFLNTLGPGGPAFTWPGTSTGGSGFGAPQYGTAYFGTANQVNWKEPYTLQWAMSVEHNVGLATGVRISYIGMKTTQLVWAPNWNQSLPSTIPFTSQPLSSRPYPNWGRVEARDIGATANYNAIEIEASHRIGGGLTFDSTYTYARNLADNQGPRTTGGFCGETACNRSADFYDRHSEYGNTFGPRHLWRTTLIYQLPFGTGRHFLNSSNRFVNAAIGGWQSSNIIEFQSGPFLSPYFSGGDPSGTGSGNFMGRAQSPDHIGPAYPATQTANEWFLASGFVCPGGNCKAGINAANPPIGRFGNAGIGTLEGPGTIDWDAGLSKSFQLTERARLSINVSFVDVLNHVNLGNPDMKITSVNNPAAGQCGFGCITGAQGLYEFAGAREGQIGARIDF